MISILTGCEPHISSNFNTNLQVQAFAAQSGGYTLIFYNIKTTNG